MWIHLTARMPPGAPNLTCEDTGAWLWTNLREAFPRALASVLMPKHPHLIPHVSEIHGAEERLARLLGHFCRTFEIEGSCRVPQPRVIEDVHALARQVRYVALNPCRDRLSRCPLDWPWTTHRDIVGAIVDPWVTAERLADTLWWPSENFAEEHHAYVSGDPSANVAGTPFPAPAEPTLLAELPLRVIGDAVAAVMRTPVAAIQKRGSARALFIALAREHGWDSMSSLARACGCTPRTIRNHHEGVDPTSLRAARLALGDARLRRAPLPPFRSAARSPDRDARRRERDEPGV
jgi:hypothetical protein